MGAKRGRRSPCQWEQAVSSAWLSHHTALQGPFLCQPDSIQLLRWCKCFVRVLKNQDLEDNLRFRTSQTSVFPFKSLSRFNSLPNKDALSAVTKIKIAPMNCLAAAFLYFRCYSC